MKLFTPAKQPRAENKTFSNMMPMRSEVGGPTAIDREEDNLVYQRDFNSSIPDLSSMQTQSVKFYAYCGNYLGNTLRTDENGNQIWVVDHNISGTLVFSTSTRIEGRNHRMDYVNELFGQGENYQILMNNLPQHLTPGLSGYEYRSIDEKEYDFKRTLPTVEVKINYPMRRIERKRSDPSIPEDPTRYPGRLKDETSTGEVIQKNGGVYDIHEYSDDKLFIVSSDIYRITKAHMSESSIRTDAQGKHPENRKSLYFECGKYLNRSILNMDGSPHDNNEPNNDGKLKLKKIVYSFENGDITYSPFFPVLHSFLFERNPDYMSKANFIIQSNPTPKPKTGFFGFKFKGGRRYKTKRLKRRKHRKTARRRPKY